MARHYFDRLTSHVVAVVQARAQLNTELPHHKRHATLIQNHGTDVLYIGGPTVTVDNGMRLAANEHLTVEGPAPIYGISVGTSSARVIEFE